MIPDNTPDYTPITEHIHNGGRVWLKRDDTYAIADVPGGKVRTCWHLARGASGLITAGSRASPQVNIVAHIAHRLGIPCRVHVPQGELSPEVVAARDIGAEVIQHHPGYNTVIVRRAHDDALHHRNWREIPFGMECSEAVRQTSGQVFDLPPAKRIIVPVGSGMSLAGILHGLKKQNIDTPVVGIVVGADPTKRLDRYAPPLWRRMATLMPAGVDYHTSVDATIDGIFLDPIYEAKCIKFLKLDDLLWCVGIRQTTLISTDNS